MSPLTRRECLRSLILALIVPLLMLTSLAAQAEGYEPLQVARDDFYGVIQTVALWPISLPSRVRDRDEVSRLIEAKIIGRLESKGLRVLPSSLIESRWEAAAKAMGGLVDPVTGEYKDEALDAARSLLRIELALRDGVDATVSTRVSSGYLTVWAQNKSYVPEDGGPRRAYTSWMAGREPIKWLQGRLHSRWINRPTRVLGDRLGVLIHDTAGVELYNIMSAIRYTKVYVRGGREEREDTSLLSHEDQIDEAINVLLDPLDSLDLSDPPDPVDPPSLLSPPEDTGEVL